MNIMVQHGQMVVNLTTQGKYRFRRGNDIGLWYPVGSTDVEQYNGKGLDY